MLLDFFVTDWFIYVGRNIYSAINVIEINVTYL